MDESLTGKIAPGGGESRLIPAPESSKGFPKIFFDKKRGIRYFQSREFVERDQEEVISPSILAMTAEGEALCKENPGLLRAIAEVDFTKFPGVERISEGQTGIIFRVPIGKQRVLAIRYLKKADLDLTDMAETRVKGWEPAVREMIRIIDLSRWVDKKRFSQKWGINFRIHKPVLATQDVLVSEWVEGERLSEIVDSQPRGEKAQEGVRLAELLTKTINRFVTRQRIFLKKPSYKGIQQDMALVNIIFSPKESSWVVLDPFGFREN